MDPDIGLALIDRFTYFTLEFFQKVQADSNRTLYDMLSSYKNEDLQSTLQYAPIAYPRSPARVYLTEFFGSVSPIKLTQHGLALDTQAKITSVDRSGVKEQKSLPPLLLMNTIHRLALDLRSAIDMAITEYQWVLFAALVPLIALVFVL